MRITGGTYRGRALTCPPGVIRPAMDRMRETMFAVLGDVAGRSFLDLFSGSGTVGVEALSRGAEPVVLVEKDRGKRRTIVENLTGIAPRPRVLIEPVERFVARNRDPFAFVYLDPPFDYRFKQDLMRRLADSATCTGGTVALIHAPREDQLEDRYGSLARYDVRRFGRSILYFYRYE